MSVWRRYGYAWVTLALFLLSLTSHWVFGWFAYVDEQQAHDAPVEVSSYLNEMARDTLENWQSEFLQPALAGRRSRPSSCSSARRSQRRRTTAWRTSSMRSCGS
jgi:hypothetical protein